MKSIEYYRKLQNAYSLNTYSEMLRQEKIDDIDNDFEECLDVDTFQFVYKDNQEIKLEIHSINFNTSNITTQKFKSKINSPVSRGDVLYNLKQNLNWLCIDARPVDYLYYTGTLRQCDYHMRWQDEKGKIINKWCCLTTASQYNSGEEADKQLTIGYNQLLIYMPLDEDTIKLKSDKRFFIDSDKENPKPYRLTRVDTVSMAYDGQGCIVLLVTECQYNPDTDSIEHMICDYQDILPTNITINFYGNNEVGIGRSKTYYVNSENNFIVNWELIDSLNNGVVLNVNNDNSNQCKIVVSENESLIGQEVVIKCVDSNGVTGIISTKIVGDL